MFQLSKASYFTRIGSIDLLKTKFDLAKNHVLHAHTTQHTLHDCSFIVISPAYRKAKPGRKLQQNLSSGVGLKTSQLWPWPSKVENISMPYCLPIHARSCRSPTLSLFTVPVKLGVNYRKLQDNIPRNSLRRLAHGHLNKNTRML